MRHLVSLISLFLFLPSIALALVNINTASISELDTLPGVGPAIAEKIIAARPFSSTSDIQNVQGIGGPGSKTYDDIIGLITVSGDTTGNPDDESEDKSIKTSGSGSVTERSPRPAPALVSDILITAPSHAFIDQPVIFTVRPKEGVKERLIRYRWNFGDGATDFGSEPVHHYRFPGTYIVMVESYYLKETKIARHEIVISAPKLSVSRTIEGVTITNHSEDEIDLSNMTLSSGAAGFQLPKYSFLLPGASLTLDQNPAVNAEVRLLSAQGRIFASSGAAATDFNVKNETAFSPQPRISAVSTSREKSTVAADDSPSLTPVAEAAESVPELSGPYQAAALSETELPSRAWPYLGLLAVISLGFLAIFSTVKKNADL